MVLTLIAGSSRVGGLPELLHEIPGHLESIKLPGGHLPAIANLVLNRLANARPRDHPVHVYFVAGMPDCTTMIRQPGYQEVIFTGHPQDKVTAVLHTIMQTEAAVQNAGATPVFCTIAPMSFKKWNNKRLGQGKTRELRYTHMYQDWQRRLNHTIATLNEHIHRINSNNSVQTPRLAESIFDVPQFGRLPRLIYNRL